MQEFLNSNTVFEVLISFGSEFHTFGPLKEKLDLYNSVFGCGTRKLSDDEILVSYDSLLFAETIRFDKYSRANSFLAHLAKGHVSFCHHLASVVRRKLSHFNLLLRNHWANCNQTLVEWSLDGPLPKMCQVIPTSNQDGRQAKISKKGGWNFNCPLLL